jgi:hypothetical protein
MSVRGTLAIVVGVPISVMVVMFVTLIMPVIVMVILDFGIAFTATANRAHYSNSCS